MSVEGDGGEAVPVTPELTATDPGSSPDSPRRASALATFEAHQVCCRAARFVPSLEYTRGTDSYRITDICVYEQMFSAGIRKYHDMREIGVIARK